MVQTDLLQLLIKPVKSLVSKEDVEKPSNLLQKQLDPVSWKGQADKNLDSEMLLQCKKALSGGKQKPNESIPEKNIDLLAKKTMYCPAMFSFQKAPCGGAFL